MLKCNTFSITARHPRTGELGIAISTAVPAVGSLCPYIRAQIGAACTQSFTNPYLAIWSLDSLSKGLSASQALEAALSQDSRASLRQVAVVDAQGRTAVHTGTDCDGWAGHRTAEGVVIAGNMLRGPETLNAMLEHYQRSEPNPFDERLLGALEAGQQAGGDKRGKQSSALLVYGAEEYPTLSLRVDDHPDPVVEIRRIREVCRSELDPMTRAMPTKDNPAGTYDLDEMRRLGILRDG